MRLSFYVVFVRIKRFTQTHKLQQLTSYFRCICWWDDPPKWWYFLLQWICLSNRHLVIHSRTQTDRVWWCQYGQNNKQETPTTTISNKQCLAYENTNATKRNRKIDKKTAHYKQNTLSAQSIAHLWSMWQTRRRRICSSGTWPLVTRSKSKSCLFSMRWTWLISFQFEIQPLRSCHNWRSHSLFLKYSGTSSVKCVEDSLVFLGYCSFSVRKTIENTENKNSSSDIKPTEKLSSFYSNKAGVSATVCFYKQRSQATLKWSKNSDMLIFPSFHASA